MNQHNKVYNNTERKRELLIMLKEQHTHLANAADVLEQKAWQLLEVTSGTVGIVSGLLVSFVAQDAPPIFWLGMGVVLFLFLIQLWQVLLAIRPMEWAYVPGGLTSGHISFEDILDKYFLNNPSEDAFLNQLIADYAGNDDISGKQEFILGAIQKVEANNRIKARRVTLASLLLGIIVAGLIGLAIATIVNSNF